MHQSIMERAGAMLRNETTGEVIALGEVTVIGRSRECGVTVADPRVSRRHAMIRRQADGYWFFDLGSINGSSINDRRVTTSRKLVTGDRILIADHRLRFDGVDPISPLPDFASMAEHTIAEVRLQTVVLLVSDIQGFTPLSEKLAPEQLAPIIGSWYERTQTILDRHGATLDKFIGDCVLAYWLGDAVEQRLAALKVAYEMQHACREIEEKHRKALEPTGIRFGSGAAVHVGAAACGSFGSRNFTLLGDAVNLTFRLEALTRVLGEQVLLSSDTLAGWAEGAAICHSLGRHVVKGRAQEVEVFALDRDPSTLDDRS
jgi:adenylate cyclase